MPARTLPLALFAVIAFMALAATALCGYAAGTSHANRPVLVATSPSEDSPPEFVPGADYRDGGWWVG